MLSGCSTSRRRPSFHGEPLSQSGKAKLTTSAYIVVSPDSGIKSLDQQLDFAKEVQAWVAARVAQHKRFRGGVVVTVAIPKSPSGKILRRHLRDRAAAEFCSVEQSRL